MTRGSRDEVADSELNRPLHRIRVIEAICLDPNDSQHVTPLELGGLSARAEPDEPREYDVFRRCESDLGEAVAAPEAPTLLSVPLRASPCPP